MTNPYKGAQVTLANGDPIEALRLGGSAMAAVSSSGEINAHNKTELIQQIDGLMRAMSSGQLQRQLMSPQEMATIRDEHRAVLSAAYADDKKWASLGSSIALKLQEQRNREGFMRRLMAGTELKQGDIARFSMPKWNTSAIVATSSANVGYQLVREAVFTPPEFEIIANVRVEALQLEQVSSDLLDDAYNQAADSILVQEDRLWKRMADKTVGASNPLEYITGELTPKMLGALIASVSGWNIPVTSAVMANDFWPDIIGNSEWHSFFDPVTRYDLVMNGQIGTLLGLNIITDAYRQENQKVLKKGELYVVAGPENHGAFSDRGGVRSQPTTGANDGSTSKGWLLNQFLSSALTNPRSVAKGQRV